MSRAALAMDFQRSIGIVEKGDEVSKGARTHVYLWHRSGNGFMGEQHSCNEQASANFLSPWNQIWYQTGSTERLFPLS